ncbi:MAG: dihydropteroate synthase, partial [Eubacteriales bacterium]
MDTPIALDTTNADALEAGVKAAKKGTALINSVTVQPARMERLLPLVTQYDADIIGVLWGPDGMPRDENERAMHAAE